MLDNPLWTEENQDPELDQKLKEDISPDNEHIMAKKVRGKYTNMKKAWKCKDNAGPIGLWPRLCSKSTGTQKIPVQAEINHEASVGVAEIFSKGLFNW